MLRTIEEALGLTPLGLNDALQQPMTEVFCEKNSKDEACKNLKNWSYVAIIPKVLRTTKLLLPPLGTSEAAATADVTPKHNAAYWAEQTKGFDFSEEDKLDSALFNQVLWKGLMGDQPYPTERSGQDFRWGREELLKRVAQKNRN